MLELSIYIVLAVLLGSLPSGVFVAKILGSKDPRTVGSGNIGAANMVRSGGPKAGLLTFLLDFSKGFLPVFLLQKYGKLPADFPWILGTVLVLAHCYSIFLGLRGGKGVATAAGVFFALAPLHAGVGLVAWALIFLISRTASLAAIAAVFAVVFSLIASGPGNPAATAGLIILVTIIRRHEENLNGLIAGKENRFI